jgi:hypothetical protein
VVNFGTLKFKKNVKQKRPTVQPQVRVARVIRRLSINRRMEFNAIKQRGARGINGPEIISTGQR